MKYEKAMAEVVVFDNSDVLMANSNCGNGNFGNQGNNCKEGANNNVFDCSQNESGNHESVDVTSEMWDAGWLG